MIVFVGQVGGDFVDREAFQEIDYRRMYGSVAKWAAQIDRAERIPEYVARAYRVAMSGRPGPGRARAAGRHAGRARDLRRCPARGTGGRRAGCRADRERAAAARRRRGGRSCSSAAADGMPAPARRCGNSPRRTALPVACAFRSQDLFDNRHRNYAGDVGIGVNPRLAARVREADVLLVIGERLGEITTSGYTLLDVPAAQAAAHSRACRRRRAGTRLPARARRRGHARRLPRRDESRAAARRGRMARERLESAHDECVAWRARAARPRRARHVAGRVVARRASPRRCDSHQRRGQLHGVAPPPLPVPRLSHAARARIPARWATACRRRSPPRRLHPERMVVSWNGDGCFLMNGQELATAVQYGLAVIFVVVDNGMYGTIRMHQERTYPARVSGTDLVNPDFAALARAYGAHGETVARTEEFAPGLRARARQRQARAPASQARSAGAHAQCIARRAARAGARGEVIE